MRRSVIPYASGRRARGAARLRELRKAGALIVGVAVVIATATPMIARRSEALTLVSFRDGVDGYAATLDTMLADDEPDTPQGGRDFVTVDLDEGSLGVTQGLVAFPGMFGGGPGQIPPGAQIISATLELYVTSTAPGAAIGFHRMLQPWDESSTWDSAVGGIQTDDVEAASAPVVVFVGTGTSGSVAIGGLEPSVQAWSDGAPNHGWVLVTDSGDGWDFSSSEEASADRRPRLVVEHSLAPGFDQDLGDRADSEGAVVSLPAPATDPDGDALIYTATGLPRGLEIDPVSGLISGTIGYTTQMGSPYSVMLRVTDPSGAYAEDSFAWTVGPSLGMLVSTRDDVPSPSGAPGLAGWGKAAVLSFGDPGLLFEPTGTAGTFDIVTDLETLGATDVNGLHLVERDLTVGAGPSVSLRRGDLLFSLHGGDTLSSSNTLAAKKEDIVRFRPDVPGDYSVGTFAMVLEDPLGHEVRGFTLVEADTQVGDVLVGAGSFLVTRSGGAEHSDVYLYVPATAGPGATSGVLSNLLEGDETGIDEQIWGLELLEEGMGGPLTQGAILVTLDKADQVAGVSFDPQDVIAMSVTATTLGGGPAQVGAAPVFRGGEVGLDTSREYLDALAFVAGNRAPSFDQDHGDRAGAEGDVVSLPASATDLDGDPLVFSAVGLPPGLSINAATGTVFGAIDYAASAGSPYSVDLRVTDPGGLSDSDTFTWTVSDTPRGPTFDQDLGDRTDAEGDVVSTASSATDPDGDTITYSATGLPPGITIDPPSGQIAGTMDFSAAAGSPYAVLIRAEEPGGLFDTDGFIWTVTDVAVPLDVVKTSDGLGRVDPGEVVEYTITVTNGSGVRQTGIAVVDAEPAGTTYAADSTAIEMPAAARDGFDAQAYDGSNGALGWSGDWVEGDGGPPDAGEDQVVGSSYCVSPFCLRLGPGMGGEWVSRPVDLGGRSAATLEFWATRRLLGDAGGAVTVEVRGGGLGWTPLQTIAMNGTDPAPIPYSFDIGGFVGTDTEIRFRGEGDWDSYFYIDEVAVVADGTVMVTGGPPPTLAAGLELSPGETLWVRFRVTVDDPVSADLIVNMVTVTSDAGPVGYEASVTDEVERSPVFDQDHGGRTDAEAAAVSLPSPATDPNGDPITYGATGLPPGVTIDPATGLVSGTIGYYAAAGSPYAVELRATDPAGGFDIDTFNWTVTDTNQPPSVTNPGARSSAEGDPVAFAMAGSDPEGDTLAWSATGLPGGLSIDPASGVISGTITYAASSGSPYAVEVRATDDGTPALDDSVTFLWSVADTNRAPVVTDPGNQSDAEGDAVSLTIVGSDPDGDPLTWTATGLPGGLSINPGSGMISGTVTYDAAAASPFTVTITATDDGVPPLEDVATFSWAVTDINRPPVVLSPGDQAGAEGAVVSLVISGSDPDGDPLTWTATGLPGGLSINPGSGMISGSASYSAAAASPYAVTVTVLDDGVPSLRDGVAFTWTVLDTNRAPTVTRPADRTDGFGDAVTLTLLGSDPDGDALSWSVAGLPTGLSVNSVSGVVSGVATRAGVFTVTATATDGGVPSRSAATTLVWTITAPGVPVIDRIPNQYSTVSDAAALSPSATHPDGLELGWTAVGLPPGTVIDPATGAISGILAEAGVFEVTLAATDTLGGVGSVGFTWIVGEEPNGPPTPVEDSAALVAGDLDDDGGVIIDVLGNDTDPDGDPLTLVSVSGVTVGEVTFEDGRVAFTPPEGWVGTTTFTYTIADPAGHEASSVVTVTINPDLNELLAAPVLEFDPEDVRRVDLASVLTADAGTDLVFGTVLQSLHVLRMPLALLGAAVLWSLLLGGLLNLGVVMRGGVPFFVRRRSVPMAIVLAPQGGKVPVHAEPGEGEVLWRFAATDRNVAATGLHRSPEGEEWVHVETPEGRGWVAACNVTEQIDAASFVDDPQPRRILEELIDCLESGDDFSHLISRHGLWVSHHDAPIHYAPDQIPGLPTDTALNTWPGRNPAYPDAEGSFTGTIAAGILTAWAHPRREIAIDQPAVPSTIIPVEFTNFRSVSIGADLQGRERLDQAAWMVFFSYEDDHPRIIALHKEG